MNKKLINKFSKLVSEIFKKPLESHGFSKESMRIDTDFFDIIYGNGLRYIKITANTYSRDYPPYFVIALGEGSRDTPDRDWNSIALWRLKNLIQKNNDNKEYSLEDPNKICEELISARKDLLEFGNGFLTGDVSLFNKARSMQNKDREPYRIHITDENGQPISYDDPESVTLKNKYS